MNLHSKIMVSICLGYLLNAFGLTFGAEGDTPTPSESSCKSRVRSLLKQQPNGAWIIDSEAFKKIRPELQERVLENAVKVVLAKSGELELTDLHQIFDAAYTSVINDFKFEGAWWSTNIFTTPTALARQLLIRLEKSRDFQILSASDRAAKKLYIRRRLFFWLPDEMAGNLEVLKAPWQFEAARAVLETWDSSGTMINSENSQSVVGVKWERLIGQIFENENQLYLMAFNIRERELKRHRQLRRFDLTKVKFRDPNILVRDALRLLNPRP